MSSSEWIFTLSYWFRIIPLTLFYTNISAYTIICEHMRNGYPNARHWSYTEIDLSSICCQPIHRIQRRRARTSDRPPKNTFAHTVCYGVNNMFATVAWDAGVTCGWWRWNIPVAAAAAAARFRFHPKWDRSLRTASHPALASEPATRDRRLREYQSGNESDVSQKIYRTETHEGSGNVDMSSIPDVNPSVIQNTRCRSRRSSSCPPTWHS